MSIITAAATQNFIHKARLPSLPRSRRLRSGGVEDQPPLQLKSTEAQTLVVGSGLVIAAQKVPVATREDLINCTLFAQLVASAEVGDMSLVNEWYAAYFRALTTLGWAQSDSRFEEYDFSSDGAAAHEAVIPVLTALLGPQAAALAVVQATLDGLQSMNENSPWITLFEQQSRSEHSAHFQVATAEVDAAGLLQIALAAFDLKTRAKLVQVLFFKYNRSSTRLRYSAGKATIYEAALAGQREVLAARLAAYRAAYVGQVRLPPLPALPAAPLPRSRARVAARR
jgi:hypothetical protein